MGHLGLQKACRGFRNNKSGYTLLELAITLAVILILSTIGLYFYQGALAYARETVCQTNLKALKTAIEEYSLENDALPATLGQLKLKHFETGYAKALEDRGWVTKFSLFLIKLDESGQAYAQLLTYENLKKYGVSQKVFHCPADDNGSPSYGINAAFAGKRWSEIDKHDVIVADCDYYVFTSPAQLSKRHRHKAFAIKKNGQLLRVGTADDADVDDAEIDAADTDDDKVTICHDEKNTLTISKSALPAHLAHGDTIGACGGADETGAHEDGGDEEDDDDD